MEFGGKSRGATRREWVRVPVARVRSHRMRLHLRQVMTAFQRVHDAAPCAGRQVAVGSGLATAWRHSFPPDHGAGMSDTTYCVDQTRSWPGGTRIAVNGSGQIAVLSA